MSTFLIGYDLKKVGQDYETLITEIKKLGAWWHCLDSTWLVKCNSTTSAIRDYLIKYIDSNDRLLVIDVSGDSAAWVGFPQDCSKWILDNL